MVKLWWEDEKLVREMEKKAGEYQHALERIDLILSRSTAADDADCPCTLCKLRRITLNVLKF